jgi:hypothetical protein
LYVKGCDVKITRVQIKFLQTNNMEGIGNADNYREIYKDEELNVVFDQFENSEDAEKTIGDKIETAVAEVENSNLPKDEINAKVDFLHQIKERASKIIFDKNVGSNMAAISLMVLGLSEIAEGSVDSNLLKQARIAAVLFGLFGSRIQLGVNEIESKKAKNLEPAV